jgi:preprotein translocase subunit YajC
MAGLSGITSNIIHDKPASPMSLEANILMLLIIVALAAYLIYRHRKRQRRALA